MYCTYRMYIHLRVFFPIKFTFQVSIPPRPAEVVHNYAFLPAKRIGTRCTDLYVSVTLYTECV